MKKKYLLSKKALPGLVGALLLSAALAQETGYAQEVTYKYLDKTELSQQELGKLKTGQPEQAEDIYYLVYGKDGQASLPFTGTNDQWFPLLGLVALGSVIVIFSKRRKQVLGIFLVSAAGLVTLHTAVEAASNQILVSYNQTLDAADFQEAIISIEGYHYLGYLLPEDLDQALPNKGADQGLVPANDQQGDQGQSGKDSQDGGSSDQSGKPDQGGKPVTPTTPDQPNDPDTPSQPDTPDTPNKPDTPDTPTNPDTPDTPDTPDQPNKPDQPDNPDLPDQPVQPDPEPVTPDPVKPEPAQSDKGEAPQEEGLPKLVITSDQTVEIAPETINQEDPDKYEDEVTTVAGTAGQKRIISYYEEAADGTKGAEQTTEIILTPASPTIVTKGTKVRPITEKGEAAQEEKLPSLVITSDKTVDIAPETINQEDPNKYEDEVTTVEGTPGQKRIISYYEEAADGTKGAEQTTEIILTPASPTIVTKGTKVRKYIDIKERTSNISKFLPYYNDSFLDKQAAILDQSGKITKQILSVTPMTDNAFTPLGDNLNKVFVLYADGTGETFTLSKKTSFDDKTTEYSVDELGILYTPYRSVDTDDLSKVKEAWGNVDLYSDAIYDILKGTVAKPESIAQYVQELYFDEDFAALKDKLDHYITLLLDQGISADQLIANKEKIMLALSYLNHYYDLDFGTYNIKDLLLTNFYGTNKSPLNLLLAFGADYAKLQARNSATVFNQTVAPYTQSSKLMAFLDFNRTLFTDYASGDDWFKSAPNLVIEERASEVPELANTSYKAYDKLQQGEFINYILPMLTAKKTQLYVISNYSTLVFGSKDRRPNDSQETWLAAIKESADNFRNYLDAWYRIADDSVKGKLVQTRNLPIWEGYNSGGWVDRFGRLDSDKPYEAIRQFFGPIGKYYPTNHTGAYAQPTATPSIHFVVDDVLSSYGQSVYTHEVTHIYDRSIYLGGYSRRDGMGAESFAQGLLQIPRNGGELGINLMFTNPNDGSRFYNPSPEQFKSQADVDAYMKRFINSLMILEYAEAQAVLSQNNQTLTNGWYRKVDRTLKANGYDQLDTVRSLNDTEKATAITSIEDLVNNNYMSNYAYNVPNGSYDGNTTAYSNYIAPNMLLSIYGGNTSDGAAGALMFKVNAFHLWAYYGYSKGFVGYTSNKYSANAKADGTVLSDKYIIQKLSDGQFQTLEDWKNAYYKEVKADADRYFKPVTVNGVTLSSYEDLEKAFSTIVTANLSNGGTARRQLYSLKEAIYKQWLKDTNGFQENTIGE